MILQYETNGKEIYRESSMIAFAEIIAVGKRFEDIDSILDFSEKQIKYRPQKVEVCSDSIFDKGKLRNMHSVKMVILSDSVDKKKNNTLLFHSNSDIYLLNDNGKTLKRL